MIWSEVQITTTPEAEEAVANAFYEAGAGGVAIESSLDLETLWGDPLVGYIDEELLNRPANTSLIRGYFPVDAKSDEKIQEILIKIAKLPEYGLNPGSGELKIVEVKDEDWENSWKKYFVATHVTPKFVVVPSWEEYSPNEGEQIIKMDPGMAFGTGTHETTKLCAELLEQYLEPGSIVADVGTGTGILAIIAAKLGADKVYAIDIDPIAIKVAKENVAKNDELDKVTLIEGDLLERLGKEVNLDIIVANILPRPIIELIPTANKVLPENGIFIGSGIINEALADVVEALEENSFTIQEIKQLGEWNAIAALRL